MKPKKKQRQSAEVHSPSSEIPIEETVPTPSNDLLPSEEAKEIAKLKKRVKKLKRRRKSRPAGLRRLKKVGMSKQVESFEEKNSLGAQEDTSKQGRNIKDIDQDAEIALVDEAQGRMHDAKMFGVDDLEGNEVFVDSVAPTTATTADVNDELTLEKTLITIKAAKPKDKGKANMIEPEKPLKKKDQIALDEEVARKLKAKMRAEMEEEERIAREKDEANKAVIEEWDYQKDFKGKSFDDIKIIFDKVYKRVNTFMDMDTENMEESLKKTVAEGGFKRAELKRCLEIIPDDDHDVAIEATPLSFKSPTIVDYKIYRERKKSYFKIIRADGNLQNYLTFGTMFKNFNREDLEVLRSIVKERFKKTKSVNDIENLLFQTLKTMFEPHVEDVIWKYQQGAVKVNNRKNFDSCGVYYVRIKTGVLSLG
nr:hypothetical protein [Tanacetum cinerariifolium]